MGLFGNLFKTGYTSKEHIDHEIAMKQKNIEQMKGQIARLRAYAASSSSKETKESVKRQIEGYNQGIANERRWIAELREQKKMLK